jgi:hypothetical protein
VVSALSVRHAQYPRSRRIQSQLFSVVLGGDQAGLNPRFVEFASGVDVLVLHAIVTNRAKDHRLGPV